MSPSRAVDFLNHSIIPCRIPKSKVRHVVRGIIHQQSKTHAGHVGQGCVMGNIDPTCAFGVGGDGAVAIVVDGEDIAECSGVVRFVGREVTFLEELEVDCEAVSEHIHCFGRTRRVVRAVAPTTEI